MKQTFDFEQFDPPILNENILRRDLEKRAERQRTVLLTIAGERRHHNHLCTERRGRLWPCL